MKKIIPNLVGIFIWIACFYVVFLLRSVLDNFSYVYSILVGMWIIFLVLWQVIFNMILKYDISENKSLIVSIIEIAINAVVVIGAYYLLIYLHDKFLPNEAYWTNLIYSYEANDLKQEALEFLNYTYMVKNLGIPVVTITIVNTAISTVIMIFAKITEKCKNKRKFIFEKILKLYFVCFPIISIAINLWLVPGKYVFILIARPLFVCLCILIIAMYLFLMLRALKSIEKDNKNENLIIVQDVYNFKFNVMTSFHNSINMFSKDKLSKTPIIYGVNTKDAFIVSNDIVRNNLINVKKYKKVCYFVDFSFISAKYVNWENTDYLDEFFEHIKDLQNNKEKLVILSSLEHLDEEWVAILSKEFSTDFYIGMNASFVIEELLKKKDNKDLENNVEAMIKYLKEKNFSKNKFISFIYNELCAINPSDSVKAFHSLMKICEYMIRYRGIENICENKDLKHIKFLTKNSIGDWNNAQAKMPKDVENKENVLKALSRVIEKLDYNSPNMESRKISINPDDDYINICEKLITIRNRTIGHGNITYDISNEIVADVALITKSILIYFVENYKEIAEGADFGEDTVPSNIKAYEEVTSSNNIKETYIYNYGQGREKDKKIHINIYEYLNYATGKIICKNDKKAYRLTIKDTDPEMELDRNKAKGSNINEKVK